MSQPDKIRFSQLLSHWYICPSVISAFFCEWFTYQLTKFQRNVWRRTVLGKKWLIILVTNLIKCVEHWTIIKRIRAYTHLCMYGASPFCVFFTRMPIFTHKSIPCSIESYDRKPLSTSQNIRCASTSKNKLHLTKAYMCEHNASHKKCAHPSTWNHIPNIMWKQ